MIPAHLRFSRLKRLVSIEQVLAHRGLLARMRRQTHTLLGPCPIHHGDNPRAFVVSCSKNLWRCFTGCDAGGDVVELVRGLDQCSYPQVAHYLSSLALDPHPAFPPVEPVTRPQKPFSPFRRRLPLDPEADFLRNKAIRPQIARRFEAGLYRGPGFLSDAIGVRLHDPEAQPLGYAARRLDPRQVRDHGKWNFPPRLPKDHLLYNFHRARTLNSHTLVVVECPWGVMRLHQIAIPAVALLGTHLSAVQHQLLLPTPHLIVMTPPGERPPHASANKCTLTPTCRSPPYPTGSTLMSSPMNSSPRPFSLSAPHLIVMMDGDPAGRKARSPQLVDRLGLQSLLL